MGGRQKVGSWTGLILFYIGVGRKSNGVFTSEVEALNIPSLKCECYNR